MYKFQRIKKKKKNLDLGTPILNMNSEEHKPKKKNGRKHYFVPYILGL